MEDVVTAGEAWAHFISIKYQWRHFINNRRAQYEQ